MSTLAALDLDGSVLVEIDFQGWVLDLAHDAAVVEHAVAVRRAMSARPRVCTRYLDAVPGPRSDLASSEARFVPGLEPGPGDPILTKHGKDVFADTDLEALLRDLDVRTIVLTGLLTAHGVASTATSALGRGFDVVVVAPACADVSRDTHVRALEGLAEAGVTVVDL